MKSCKNNNDISNMKFINKEINPNYKNYKQLGLSTLDFMLYITLAIFLIAGFFGIYSPMSTTAKATTMLSELTTFQMKIREAYFGLRDGYSGISTAEVIKSEAYSSSLAATATTLKSNSAGEVTISDDSSGDKFSIQYSKVPSGVCKAIFPKVISSSSWSEIAVGGSTVWSDTNSTITKATINNTCNSSATVAMKFTSN